MGALLIVLAAAGLGLAAERWMALDTSRLERFAISSAVALTVAPWFLFLGAWGLGYQLGLPLGTAAMALAAIALGRRGRRAERPARPLALATSKLSWFVLGVLFAHLLHGHLLHDEPFGWFSGGFAYSDMPLHASLVANFSTQPAFTFESPLAAGRPLTYPFLGDFLVAMLVRGGWSAAFAFTLTSWIAIMTMLALVQAVALRMFGRSSAATLAAWFVVVNGSIGGIWYLVQDLERHGLSRTLGAMPNYAHLAEQGYHVSNLTTDFYLPQRAMVSALPAFWLVVWLLQAAVRRGGDAAARGSTRRPLLAAGAATAAMPLLSTHAFFVALALLAWFTLWRTIAGRRAPWDWLAGAALALALAAPQLGWQFGQTWNSGFGRWNLGWMAPDGALAWFWVKNGGVALPLAAINIAIAWRLTRRDFALPLYSGLMIVFVAANLYQFQPNVWDNMKFLIFGYMGVALLAAGGLAHWLAAGGARRVVAAVMVVGMTASGTAAVVVATDKHDQIASRYEVNLGMKLREVIPAGALVLCADNHNHLVPMITGRRVVMAFRGWLWTHGIDYGPLERQVTRMFAGGAEGHLTMRKVGVTHVYVGARERDEWKANVDDFRQRYATVYSADGIEVFDARRQLRRVAARAT